MPIGRPRDARLDDAIVEATCALIGEQGYGGLTIAAVAARAGTTTAAIYRRFSSKADLVARTVLRADGDDVVADTDDIEDDLRSMVRWSFEKFCRPTGRAALAGLLGEPSITTEDDAGAVARLRVSERLARAVATGELRADVDPEAMISLLTGPALYAAVSYRTDTVDEAFVEAATRAVVTALRPDPAPARRRKGRP